MTTPNHSKLAQWYLSGHNLPDGQPADAREQPADYRSLLDQSAAILRAIARFADEPFPTQRDESAAVRAMTTGLNTLRNDILQWYAAIPVR
jgi:hypothetical protein